ncbi:alpha-ketoglutarate-dependent dioxygenase AlkB [Streptomyces durbertensis]|uniref:Alpha-ketoglutarate-dependent dioxygenase AlkB n=1 Tax=Streptomyces durbertensis TaxID=2448886 RepID=A0ABR6EGY1_9ACTN|nr:alpha-ketoglutarate-dependent dioxygenase AlkB [Streptomyces durbertensis]MBB1244586.1 alpha-ketoglutarate-dependent dioxygenase AlkB [Streptomyces durbertensis]
MSEGLFPAEPRRIAPGACHLPGWLDHGRQRRLVAACRRWALPPAGLRTVRMPSGGRMSVRQMSLGHHWYPYGYADTAVDGDGEPVKPFPSWLGEWAREAVCAAFGEAERPPRYDIALINLYDGQARMGMHRDSDERSPAPVVSFSLGDTCVFRFGHSAGRGRPYADVRLESGDAFVFGGPARLAYHGVPRVLPGSGPAWLDLDGRLNITVRER